MENPHPADVGAGIARPRATNRRPYSFYREISALDGRTFLCYNLSTKRKEGEIYVEKKQKTPCSIALLAHV